MNETDTITKQPLTQPNATKQRSTGAFGCFLWAAVLLGGVYLSELFHLLEEPLFSLVYYGNLNATFYHALSALYILTVTFLCNRRIKKHLGVRVFGKKSGKLNLVRKGVLYLMTVLPVLLTAAALGFRFKLVYELGERITGMTLLGNGVGYFHAAAKLFAAVYFIALVEEGIARMRPGQNALPIGGLAAMLTFGLLELLFTASAFSWLYLILFLYYGVIYLISRKRFAVTYTLALLLYIL